MSQHARIEELSDSDSDPSGQDPSDFALSPIRPADPPQTSPNPSSSNPRDASSLSQRILPPDAASQRGFNQSQPPPEFKHYQCIYPLYFDASKTRAEGRRVGKELAVRNPLAREIVDAVQNLGLKTMFEPGKTHPRDWANPGRVRVLVKEGGRARSKGVKNKHHLYTLISSHLRSHPTTSSSPLRLRIQGMPMPDGPAPPPAVPRGWKMNTILPLHSPALSGGGVSENIFKDIMKEVEGGGMPGLPGMGNGAVAGANANKGQNVGDGHQGKRKREGGGKKK